MTQRREWLKVESLDLEAQGVAHNAEGKVVFIEDALPGEEVASTCTGARTTGSRRRSTELRRESSQRVVPRCPHFGVCGGCKMQHLHVGAQVATKQRALEDALWHLGKVKADQLLRPIEGPAWGYRYRARLSVRHVAKKGKVLVGFHERKSSYVADMDSCEVLPPHVSELLLPLRELIAVDGPARPPAADRAGGRRRRHGAGAAPSRAAERRRPRSGCAPSRPRTRVQWWLQPKGPDTVHRLDDGGPGARLRAARVRHHDAVQADRLHPGQPRRSTGCWSARALRLLDAAARRAGDRLVLRPRQLHAAAGDAGARGARHRRQRGAGRARARERGAQRARRRTRASRRATCSS